MLNLKKALITTSFLTTFATSAFGAPQKYVFEQNHTTITWKANHFGFSNPSGKLMDVKGNLILDEENPQKSKVEVEVNPASIVTGIAKFDEHLKSADFLNVANFSKATFKSNKVVLLDKNRAKVSGILTLLGVSKNVTLDVVLNKIGENPMNKIQTAGFSAKTTIKRSDFGINYALPAVSDEVEILIEAEAQKQ